MLQTIVLVAHVGISLMIIGLVLLQRGKGADAGTGFGAGASGTVFGARGSATFFSRATGVLATLFFASCLALAYLATQRVAPTSLLETTPAPQSVETTAPTPPAASELPQLQSEPAPESAAPESAVPEGANDNN
jgi:preprotein translocase subunit SecG